MKSYPITTFQQQTENVQENKTEELSVIEPAEMCHKTTILERSLSVVTTGE